MVVKLVRSMGGVVAGMAEDVAEGASRECVRLAPCSLADFVEHAASRGFDVSNEPLAAELFEQVGCRRILRYMAFIEEHGIEGEARSLEGLSDLLAFDEAMRSLVLECIGKLETQLKARYAQCMSEEHGEYCLADKSNFKSKADYFETIRVVKGELSRWKGANGIGWKAYRDFGSVSIWTAMEACSINTVTRLLRNTRSVEVADGVAASFGVDKRCLVSWMRTLGHVRNLCAHFAPFVVNGKAPEEPKPVAGAAGDCASPLYILVIIERLLQGRRGSDRTCGGCAGGTRAEGGRAEGGRAGGGQAGGGQAEDGRAEGGRADGDRIGAKRDLTRFRWKASLLVWRFTGKHPDMATALRIPPEYANRCVCSPSCDEAARNGEQSIYYRALTLAA